MTGIYKIKNIDNNKVYVGQSLDIERRWAEHIRELNNNKHENPYLQNSWNAHGKDKFEFSVIEECEKNKLDEKEIFWIHEFRSYVGFEDSNGYNLTIGGDGTRYIHYVLQFDLSGNFIAKWNNGLEAARELKINPSSIYGCITKRLKHTNKFIFCYEEDYKDINSLDWYFNNRKTSPVIQFDLYGNKLNQWNGCAEATDYLGYNPIQCLLGDCKSCHGYIFLYEDEIYKLTEEYLTDVRESCNFLKRKRVYQLDKNGDIIRIYNSHNEVALNGFSERMVIECCKGLRPNVKGYVFCYDDKIGELTKDICEKMCSVKNKPVYKEVLKYNIDGELVKKYNRLSEVVNDGYNTGNVSDCCRGIIKQYMGYIWKYGDDVPRHNSRPVLQFDTNMNFINEFNSILEASKSTNINKSCIQGNCNHRTKTTHGYIFRYKNE